MTRKNRPTEDDASTGGTECYACGESIDEGEWVIPLRTYTAVYFGDDDEITLNADETVETVIHAECLKRSLQPEAEQ